MIDKRESKTKFLDAAMHVIRVKGYAATRIEDICDEAGLTKGSFLSSLFKQRRVGSCDSWAFGTK
jgi:hypothetical protein